jgi:glycosyltransferase involved in cell wall biosynthesis
VRILYHHRIASKDGQYVHVEELTNALIEQGHTVFFVAPEFTKKSEFGYEGGPAAKLKALLPEAIYELLELSYSFVIGIKLIYSILQNKPDFIYERYNLYQPVGVLVSKLFNVPILLEVNAPLVDERSKYSGLKLKKLAKFIEVFTWKNADIVLPVTQVLADILQKAGVNSSKITVIQNGVNEKLLNTVFKPKKKFSKDKIIIGFVGFINPWHRLDLAIDSISKHKEKNIQLVCVGDGEIRDQLEKQAKRLGVLDKVTFTGLVDRLEVFQYIAKFDIALQPSVTPYASPLKLFEYLAASCLIIAPSRSNICEIITENDALLFEPDNYDDFTNKLAAAIENYSDLVNLRNNAYNLISEKGFTWQNNAARVTRLAESVIYDNE